jgi:hypothetical protein
MLPERPVWQSRCAQSWDLLEIGVISSGARASNDQQRPLIGYPGSTQITPLYNNRAVVYGDKGDY